MNRLPVVTCYPLVVIDFEASALTVDSFPIEVGIAILIAPDAQIETWSTLIKPEPAWDVDSQWDADAECVHGIRRWDLRKGNSAQTAMEALNARIPQGCKAWCDGGHYDAHWLNVLAHAADVTSMFELADLGPVLRDDEQLRIRVQDALGNTTPPPMRLWIARGGVRAGPSYGLPGQPESHIPGVNFGRRLPQNRGQYCRPIHTFWPGLNAEAALWAILFFRAGLITAVISALANMPGLSTNGCRGLD